MAKPQEFTITQSVEELRALRKSQTNIKHEKRVMFLIYLKENKFKTRHELCDYLGIDPRTQQRWTKQYLENGISFLLTDLPKNKKSKIITPEIHKELEKRLNSSDQGFLGYWDAQAWVNNEFDIDIQYHWLRKYLIKHFKTKLKSPRKSHYKKDEEAGKAFLKTP
ncbi:winged helix-turn-helix protein [Gillisia sp. Hel_I_86]|nr:winged helix-turn-helix protein [Gillisia sp. Hel_I_86]TVZ26076.1 winged helix-turn-helix protein [Gillisia sp. Hel_I_86]TVZ26437.1 winged helix-turn-helix protein [Gillisia sp. Hel_I_86]TVZ26790.1 winged helix-turn-helix protein [Gillisia sp. Hel_I_86]